MPGSHSGYHDAFLLPLQLRRSLSRHPVEISSLPSQGPSGSTQPQRSFRPVQRGRDHRERLRLGDLLTSAHFWSPDTTFPPLEFSQHSNPRTSRKPYEHPSVSTRGGNRNAEGWSMLRVATRVRRSRDLAENIL